MVLVTSVLHQIPGKYGKYFLDIPEEQALQLIVGNYKRITCSLNGFPLFHCALHKLNAGNYAVFVNAAFFKKAKLSVGSPVNAQLEKDETKYGMAMPEELAVLLEQDDEGRIAFEKLLPGMKRSLMYYIGGAKSIDVRIRRSIFIIEREKQRAES